jgi:hypothetical protein
MFQGSVPAPLRGVIHEAVKGWGTREVYVGCSGNFTIERTLWDIGVRCHSNDVSMYSCVLGCLFAGTESLIRVKPEHQDQWDWLTPYLEAGQRERAAVLMLCTTMLAGLGRANAYYERQRRAYREQWVTLFEQTVAKLGKVPIELAFFAAEDVMTWLEQVPRDAAIISFPPFWASGYEQLYKPLDAVFEWDERPQYEVLDDERIDEFLTAVMRRKSWMVALPREREDLSEFLRGQMKTSNRRVPVSVYTNHAPSRLVMPHQNVSRCRLPIVGDQVGERAALTVLPAAEFNELRSMYLNPGIPPGGVLQAYGLLVDDLLVGTWAISRPDMMKATASGDLVPYAYLISDFPVGDGRIPRLSALVLRAALSREAQLLAERVMHRRVRGLVTTAFTNKPVSMKYRGLFRLLSRKEEPPGKYMLNYGARMGEWTLQEALEKWKASLPA